MDDLMLVSTSEYNLTVQQRDMFKRMHEEAIARERKLRESVRRGALSWLFDVFSPDDLTNMAMKQDEKNRRGKK